MDGTIFERSGHGWIVDGRIDRQMHVATPEMLGAPRDERYATSNNQQPERGWRGSDLDLDRACSCCATSWRRNASSAPHHSSCSGDFVRSAVRPPQGLSLYWPWYIAAWVVGNPCSKNSCKSCPQDFKLKTRQSSSQPQDLNSRNTSHQPPARFESRPSHDAW